MITILCWKWAGYRNIYSARHVNALYSMLQTHMRKPFRLICMTDDPCGIHADVTCRQIPEPRAAGASHGANCFHRVDLLSTGFVEWLDPAGVLSLDLDCVIHDDLSPLIPDIHCDFKILRGYAGPYNGSMIWVRPSHANTVAHTAWRLDPDAAIRECIATERIGSDQVYFALHRPGVETWGPENGALQYARRECGASPRRITFYAGAVKPWDDPVWLEHAGAPPPPAPEPTWSLDDLGRMIWTESDGAGRIDRVLDNEVQVRYHASRLRSYDAVTGRQIGRPPCPDETRTIRRLA